MRKILGIALMCAVFGSGASAEDSSEIKIELQVSMQRHIDRGLIDGQMLNLNYQEGVLERFFPTKVHTTVLKGDGYYVLCSDLKAEDGSTVDVDYYLAKGPRGFKVFKTVVNNREPLMALMKSGAVAEF